MRCDDDTALACHRLQLGLLERDRVGDLVGVRGLVEVLVTVRLAMSVNVIQAPLSVFCMANHKCTLSRDDFNAQGSVRRDEHDPALFLLRAVPAVGVGPALRNAAAEYTA